MFFRSTTPTQIPALVSPPESVDDDDVVHHDDDPGHAAHDEDHRDHDQHQGQPLLGFTEGDNIANSTKCSDQAMHVIMANT